MPFQFSAENLRRLTKAELQTDARVNILVGENMEGKTSLLGAMIVALTGSHPRWMAKQGQSIYDLRHGAAKKAELYLGLPLGGRALCVRREIAARAQALSITEVPADPQANPVLWSGTLTEQQKALYASVGLTADQLTCLLDSGQFLEKSGREQTAFLALLSGAELSHLDLCLAMVRDNRAALQTLANDPDFDRGNSWQGAQALSGIALLDAALKLAEAARRDTKRYRDAAKTRLADAEAAIPGKPEGDEPEDPQERAAAIQERTEAAKKQEGRVEAAQAAVTAAQEAVDAYELPPSPDGDTPGDVKAELAALTQRMIVAGSARKRVEDADKAVADARAKLDWIADEDLERPLTGEADGLADAVESAEEAETAASAAYRENYDRIGKLRGVKDAAAAAVAQWEALTESCCPTCKQPIDPAFVSEQLAAARATAVAADRAHQKAFDAGDKLLEVAEAAKQATVDARLRSNLWGQYTKAVEARAAIPEPESAEALDAEKACLEAWQTYQAAVNRLSGLVGLQAGLASAIATRDALEAPEATEALDAEWAILSEWTDYLLAIQTAEDARDALAELETSVEHWEWLVTKFGSGPDSYRAKLTEGKLGDLETAVNQVLEPLLDERVVFPQGDRPLSLQGMGQTYPATDQFMSGSEKLRVQVALQYAFCRALDWDLLLIDVEAMLDYATSGALMTTLKEIAVAWPEGTIFVTTAPRDPPDAPEVPGWQSAMKAKVGYFEGWARVWEVEDGRVSSLVDPDNPFDNPALREADPGGTAAHGTDGEPAMQFEIAGIREGS